MKRGKKYQHAAKLIDAEKLYSVDEALQLIAKTQITKFDPSVDITINLTVDPKKADQMIRGGIVLPNGTGKDLKIVAFVEDKDIDGVLKAGVTKAGNENLVDEIKKGWLDFDIAIATPSMMKSIAKVAKILGPKGLMPNPKTGTVSTNPLQTIAEIKKGKVEFRADSYGILHNLIGKLSFGDKKLKENITSYTGAIKDAKPASIKGIYAKSVCLNTTMGPAIKLDLKDLGL